MSFLKRFGIFVTRKPEGFFLSAALLFGVTFMVAIPPLQTPDEDVHFMRVYQLSQLKITPEIQNGHAGHTLPLSIDKTFNFIYEGNNKNVKFNPNVKYDVKQVKHALTIKNDNQVKFYETPASSSYSPIGYIPQAIGVAIGNIFDSPIILLIYLARLFNLFAWIAFVYFAIKLMPFKKWAITGVALLPMMVGQSISTGTDVMAIGSGVLFTSSLLATLSRSRLTRKQIVVIFLTAIIMVASKLVMAVLLPLVVLIAYKKKQSKYKLAIVMLLTALLPFVVFMGLSSMAGPGGGTAQIITNGEVPRDQMSYLFHEPWQFITVLFNTFFFTWGDGVITSVIGNFGWVDTPMAGSFIIMGYLLLAFMFLVNYEKPEFISKGFKLLFLAIAVIYAIAVCAAMYIYFSPVKYDIIVGVQGRYMIPSLFLLIIASYGHFLKTSKKTYIDVVRTGSLFLLVVAAVTIVVRYYITYI